MVKRFVRLLLIFALFTGYSMVWRPVGDVRASDQPVEIAVDADRMIYQQYEEVTLLILIRNMTPDTVSLLEPAIDKRSVQIEIEMPDGSKDKLLSIYGLRLKKISLKPKQRIRFSARFTPEQLGMYTVRLKYFGAGGDPVSAPDLKLNVVKAPPQK